MTFKEFMALQEDLTPPSPAMSGSTPPPVAKNNMVQTLQNVSRMPVPPGVNPSVYKNKLQNAINVARQGNASSPADAVNTVNVQNSLTQGS